MDLLGILAGQDQKDDPRSEIRDRVRYLPTYKAAAGCFQKRALFDFNLEVRGALKNLPEMDAQVLSRANVQNQNFISFHR